MNNFKHKTITLFTILVFIILIYIITLYYKKYNETFKLEPIDKTRLYGSIFLDNLDTQIKNLTDPPIIYDTKRIQIFKYNDILL